MDGQKLQKGNINNYNDQLTSLRRLSYALLGGNIFCLVIIFGPDANILSANAELEIPVIQSTINVKAFLIFFPLCLIFFNLYSQLLINAVIKTQREVEKHVETFNIATGNLLLEVSGSNCISIIVFYLLTPLTLITMSWMSLPRPESVFLIPLTIIFTTGLIFFRIWQVEKKLRLPAYLIGSWLVVSTVFILVYVIQHNFFPEKLRSFRIIDLVMADLKKSDLRNVYLPNAKMDHIILSSANLEKANLINAKLKNAQLKKTILRGACLDYASLEDAILEYADLRNATLRSAYLLKTNLEYADLSDANLFLADMERANLKNSKLHRTEFHKAILNYVEFNYAELVDTDMRWADLRHADLSSVYAPSAIFSLADLFKAKFLNAKLEGAIARAAKLEETVFTNANLYKADLSCANLKKAELKNVFLQDAILINTDFQDTDISEADLKGADLRGARNLTCVQLKSARNWRYATREKNLKCEEDAHDLFLRKIGDHQECDEVRYEIRGEIEKLNK